ncbi:MAG: hypothetical protein LBU28_08165 [Spirochaetaceae bacterium]|nr:hypothetical protein [Spirochaetaceae bacterium]
MERYVRMTLMMTAFLCLSCASKEAAPEEAPLITSATYQHTQYNGRPQAVEVKAAKDDAPLVVTYFRSQGELEEDRNGFSEAPAEVGDYYVRLDRPEGKGYREGSRITIEYHLQKAFISITADPVQRAAWDGRPKTVTAAAEPPVELLFFYYDDADPAAPLPAAPRDRGRYRVTVIFPGNERYMGASREVAFLIE